MNVWMCVNVEDSSDLSVWANRESVVSHIKTLCGGHDRSPTHVTDDYGRPCEEWHMCGMVYLVWAEPVGVA